MPLYVLVQFVLDPSITQTRRLDSGVKVLEISLNIFLVFCIKSLSKLLVDIDQFSLVDRLLFVEVVHNEKVLCLMRRDIDAVDLVKIWLTVVNHVTKVIGVTKDILTWIYKHFHLIGNEYLKSN